MRMKKYILETLFYFLLPIAAIAIVAEYSIRKIPNDYAYKSNWLDKNSHDIEALYLGPSSIAYDIDPSLSRLSGFNAAHVSQPIKYDHFIFNKYIDQMQSLKYVVLGIDYWTPYGSIEDTPEWWRVKYYTIYYDSPLHEGKSKYKYELYFHNTENFGIALKGFLRMFGLNNISHLTVNERGYGINYTTKDKTLDWDNGLAEAERHNAMISESKTKSDHYKQNLDYIYDICRKSQARGIKVILLGSPIYQSYTNTIEKKLISERAEFCNTITKSFDNAIFIDLTESELFAADDFFNANHLNEIGARKFTSMVDSIMTNH